MTLKVIGSGFGRTGTASLKVALETLMGGRCYHMSEVVGNAGHMDMWLEAAAGRPDWDSIFDGYVATVDFPGSNYWRQLALKYPDAKIIHSVRDPERWFESTQATIFSSKMQETLEGTKWSNMLARTIFDHVGGEPANKARLITAFHKQTEDVKAAFGTDRLLVFEAKQGWQPLCDFLDVPAPEEDYPYINSKEEFDGLFEMLLSPIGAAAMNGDGMPTESAHEDLFQKE